MSDDITDGGDPRIEFMQEVFYRLGGDIVDIELDPKHFDVAFKRAVMRYRQRSDNSMEESFLFIDMQPDNSTYTLPQEVQEVRAVYRRTMGGTAGGGSQIDPFSLGFVNNIYMMQNPGGMGSSGSGMLATYDFAMQFQSLAGRMFGRDIMFVWNAATKKLVLERRVTGTEQIALHVWNAKPETVLLIDPYARIWLFDYTVACCKQILGEARGKFAALAGPQGGITLNGEALKTEAKEEMDRLDQELLQYADAHSGSPFLIS